MKNLITVSAVALAMVTIGSADAYSINCKASDACDVTCDGGEFVGTMYWNGTQWSDGLRWDKDKDALAKAMVAAHGGGCR